MGRRLRLHTADFVCVCSSIEEGLTSVCVPVSACPLGLCACVCVSVSGFDVSEYEQMLLCVCLSLSFTLFIEEMRV